MKKYVAEFFAAFILIFVAAGVIVADVYFATIRVTDSFGILGIALATGLALALAFAAMARFSGAHANPAISIAFFIARKLSAKDLAGYVVAQLLGGTAAAYLLKALMPKDAVDFAGAGVTALAHGLTWQKGIAIEVVLTFFLAFAIWAVAVDKRGPRGAAPFTIGLVLTMDILVGGAMTGAAMNPARWFGPALASGRFANWQVWVVGPILGALLGSLIYEIFFLQEELPELEEEAEETPAPRTPIPASVRAEAPPFTPPPPPAPMPPPPPMPPPAPRPPMPPMSPPTPPPSPSGFGTPAPGPPASGPQPSDGGTSAEDHDSGD